MDKDTTPLTLHPIGWVESPLVDRATAPRQGDEGAPAAWLVFTAAVVEGLRDVKVGDDLLLLTWFDRARRDVLVVHPRGDLTRAPTGVFSTRSPDRPNPIGLHRVHVLAIARDAPQGLRVQVQDLEALDGTPVIDVKPVLDPGKDR
jgi:tRNA-Thr(GGU) m(6)t(6)A37 methyltransferase TsaA